jgi:mannosyltransferase
LKRNVAWILALALLLGAALRWFRIGAQGFWYDEALSSLIARLSTAQILANAAASDHPPGYYLLLHYWLSLGKSETVIRSLSAIFSLAAIPLIFGLGSWLFDRPTGLLAACGMAIFPFQIYFAQEARMYAIAIFCGTALTWLFLHGATVNDTWWTWIGYVLVAVVGLYTHYYFAFLLLALHAWIARYHLRNRTVITRLFLMDLLIVLLFLPQIRQAVARTTAYLGGLAWQSTPSLLSPLTTIYYLLFGHRSPFWLVPVGLFLALAILLLTLWESRQRPREQRPFEIALWLSLLVPIGLVMLISWFIHPIYLERSFAIAAPALLLLLARGAAGAPRRSPTPYLAALLTVPIAVTLVASGLIPDPAKPPVRQAALAIEANWRDGDASLHLQDASGMPALWYTPEIPHQVVNLPGATWTTAETHPLFGGDVSDWQTPLSSADRLWLTVMPAQEDQGRAAVHRAIESRYQLLMGQDWGDVQVYLYDLQNTESSLERKGQGELAAPYEGDRHGH